MKKTFLTLIAVGFGFSVAFAQIAPAETNQDIQTPTEQSEVNQGEQDRRQVEMSALPQETQDAFNNGAYSDFQVLAIYEIAPKAKDVASMTDKIIIYEFELAQTEGNTHAGASDAVTTDDGLAGVETERVSARQADIILQIDEKGLVVKEKNLDEMDKQEGNEDQK